MVLLPMSLMVSPSIQLLMPYPYSPVAVMVALSRVRVWVLES